MNAANMLKSEQFHLPQRISMQTPQILIVEDELVTRNTLKSIFEAEGYHVLEANNGDEMHHILASQRVDLVIMDINLPGKNGLLLAREIREKGEMGLIFLTGRDNDVDRILGLEIGADDYITKPFDISLLKAKVDNLISIRESFKAKYANEFILQPKNITISSPDERFLQKAIDAVEKYISDSELDIDKFSLEVGVSRMQLYRKLEALTGMTVKEFIRSIRLKRAAQLLVQKKLNVSEVAYAVGFKDISHFRKCFHQEFGMSATEYMEKMQS